jgi:Sec-independent protein secretion pathway component TatC
MQEESVIRAQWKFVVVVAFMIAVGTAPTDGFTQQSCGNRADRL